MNMPDAMQHIVTATLSVIGIIILFAFLLKRYQGFGMAMPGAISIISTKALGTKEALHIIEINNQQFLIGATAHHITLLDTLQDKIVAPAKSTTPHLGGRHET